LKALGALKGYGFSHVDNGKVSEGGGGFNPRIKIAKKPRALAPDDTSEVNAGCPILSVSLCGKGGMPCPEKRLSF
jgi:hypothetical protein